MQRLLRLLTSSTTILPTISLLPLIGCILIVIADIGGLMHRLYDVDDSWTKRMQDSSLIMCKILVAIWWMLPNTPEVTLVDQLVILAIPVI